MDRTTLLKLELKYAPKSLPTQLTLSQLWNFKIPKINFKIFAHLPISQGSKIVKVPVGKFIKKASDVLWSFPAAFFSVPYK